MDTGRTAPLVLIISAHFVTLTAMFVQAPQILSAHLVLTLLILQVYTISK